MIMQADKACDLFEGILIVSLAVSILLQFAYFACQSEGDQPIIGRKGLTAIWAVVILVAIGVTVTPSTKTLAAMIVVPAIANSQAVQKDFPQLYDLAVNKLKEQLAPSKEVEKK